ncbi:MAG TPA: ribonuclease Z [Pyrinomonadaceae bacterium]
MLDAGPDSTHRMAKENLDWPNLDAIWISHFHLDHCGGLPTLLFSFRHAPQTQSRTKHLSVFGPKGLRELIHAFAQTNNYKLLDQPFPVEVVEVDQASDLEMLRGVTARVFSTPHTSESMALRLTEQSRRTFVYTSDTGFSEELAKFADGADLLLMECSFRRNKPIVTHLELADALRIANASSPKQMVLTHLYPEWDDVNVTAEAKTGWQGETIEAIDGLRLNI